MLPRAFGSLSVFANYTKIKTEGNYDGNSEELVRFIPETANAGVSWRYRSLELRTAYNFKSGYLRTYNANPVARQRATDVETWDFNAQYRFSPKFTVFVDVVNAFNEWESWYTSNDPSRIIMSEVYGTRVSVGVSGRF
jgi:outer membrane cobalamin receptor